jgi:serine/threonine-protein kinase
VPTSVLLAGRYRLIDPVGRGGAGRVWRAEDETLGRPVAVKVVDLGARDSVAARRFERELQATAKLTHPNVVTVFDGGFDDDRAYLVMELLAGPSLAEVVTGHGPVGIDDALVEAEQICRGLGAAHDAGIVHRDLKPANLVRSEDRMVKIVDFGIAALLSSPGSPTRTDLTASGTVLGTSAYLSPEQAGGGPVDARGDLYALGCVLFFLLTGAPPYEGGSPVAVAAQHLHAPVPSLRDRRPEVPPALDGLARDLLAKDPGRRPQRAVDALARIQTLRRLPDGPSPPHELADNDTVALPVDEATDAGTDVVADPTERIATPPMVAAVPTSRPSPSNRHRRPLIVAAVVLALLAAAVALALVGRSPRPRRAASSVIGNRSSPPTTAPTTTSSTSTTTPPTTSTPTTSPGPRTASQAVSQLATLIQQEGSTGDLDAGAAAVLATQVTALGRAITAGKPGQVGHAVGELATRLDDLDNAGQLTTAGRAAFDAPLSALEQLYPSARPGDNGDQQGDAGG